MTHFPLNTAALCEDCREVGSDLRCCACCGSRSLMALAPLLILLVLPVLVEKFSRHVGPNDRGAHGSDPHHTIDAQEEGA